MIFFGIAKQWERHAIFFLGKFARIAGPGLYFYIPLLERVLFRVETRIVTYEVPLQRGLTNDNIPVEVDAIVFYQVQTPDAAVLNVENYHSATQLSAQAAIRDMVGKSTLDELLANREKISERVRDHVGEFTSRWGTIIHAVEIKDVMVAQALEDAIAREAEAEREKRARLKLAQAESQAVGEFLDAARQYDGHPIALQLRSMNMLYEICMEGKSTMIFVPTGKSTGGMPGIIGIESIDNILGKKPDDGEKGQK